MRAVSLSAALELDAGFAETPNALPASFGDAFLCKNNFIYRNIRIAAIARGFNYTTRPPFWYEVLPLLSLEEIYRTRLIPYRDTRRALQDLEHAYPNLFTLSDLRSVDFRRNYVMHESVHCIVHSMLKEAPSSEDERERLRFGILDRLIGEAMANAAETLGNAPCDANEHHELYVMNTFMPLRRPARARLIRVRDALGFEPTFKIVFFGYLFSNFLYQSLPAKRLVRDLAPHVELPANARTRRAAFMLFRQGFELSVRFRLEATGAALRQAGYRGAVFELLDFDFMKLLGRCETRRRLIDDCARVLERGVGALPLGSRREGSRRRSSA